MRKFLLVLVGAVTGLGLMGCGAAKKITVDSYFQDRARVDQEMSGGNAGYVTGNPSADELSAPQKKTRKVFVVEFSKAADEVDEKIYQSDVKAGTTGSVSSRSSSAKSPVIIQEKDVPAIPPIDFSDIEDDARSEQPAVISGEMTEYVVQENDTLQKISKKFYNSYNKWYIIFEANRDRIPNPDSIRPGTKLLIPNVQ